MGRRLKKNRFSLGINGHFVPLLYAELDSVAYQELTGNSAKLYGFVKRIVRTVGAKLQVTSERDVVFVNRH